MERDLVEGRLRELRGKFKQKWGELSGDELLQAEGKLEELVGRIQQRYGGTREDIRRQLIDLLR